MFEIGHPDGNVQEAIDIIMLMLKKNSISALIFGDI